MIEFYVVDNSYGFKSLAIQKWKYTGMSTLSSIGQGYCGILESIVWSASSKTRVPEHMTGKIFQVMSEVDLSLEAAVERALVYREDFRRQLRKNIEQCEQRIEILRVEVTSRQEEIRTYEKDIDLPIDPRQALRPSDD